jgi:tripeptide aminopeptidase
MESKDRIPPKETALERFLRYAPIDTQSAEGEASVPSTRKQLDLANLLVNELRELGARDVRLGDSGIVYAAVPGNLPADAKVPVIGLIAHMDTSPAVSGEHVNVIIHHDYRGGDIVLPQDPTQVITVADNPALAGLIGDDIVTADGTTLLGSDDKAGVAEILTLVDILNQNPQIRHGSIAIAFTPDEEVGRGIQAFDIEGFGATFAYSVDGNGLGEINNETWSARTAIVTFTGRSSHPGTAKGIMVNSVHALADYLSRFPADMQPETTEGRVGFIHPYAGVIDVEESSLRIAVRDFELAGLDTKEQTLREMVAQTQVRFPAVKIVIQVEEMYGNMREALEGHPELVENALEAARRAGIEPFIKPLRGGTDGAYLSARGLPTPDIFTGGYNFHGKLEFNSRRGLERSTEMLVHLVQIYAAQIRTGEDKQGPRGPGDDSRSSDRARA